MREPKVAMRRVRASGVRPVVGVVMRILRFMFFRISRSDRTEDNVSSQRMVLGVTASAGSRGAGGIAWCKSRGDDNRVDGAADSSEGMGDKEKRVEPRWRSDPPECERRQE